MKKVFAMMLMAMSLMMGCSSDSGTNADGGNGTPGYSLSGTVKDMSGKPVSGIVVTLAGGSASAQITSTSTDANGAYVFTGLSNGIYVITSVPIGYTFDPPYRTVTVLLLSQTGLDFTAVSGSDSTNGHTVSGTVKDTAGTGIPGVTLALTNTSAIPVTVTSGADGSYSFSGVADGSYFVTPVKKGYVFTPVYGTVTVNGADQTGLGFTGVVSESAAKR